MGTYLCDDRTRTGSTHTLTLLHKEGYQVTVAALLGYKVIKALLEWRMLHTPVIAKHDSQPHNLITSQPPNLITP